MKGPGILTVLMFVTLAVFAYAQSSARAGQRDASGLFSRKVAKTSCPLGSRYSSFYNECVRSVAYVAD